MNNKTLNELSKVIWDAINNERKINLIPKNNLPLSRDFAYKIQSNYINHTKYKHIGYKIAATSSNGQKHIKVSAPISGHLFEHNLFKTNTSIRYKKNSIMRVAEPEIAFKISKNIKKNKYTVRNILSVVDAVYPAIELPDTRFQTFKKAGEFLLIADNACANYFIIGNEYRKPIKNIQFDNIKVTISNEKEVFEGNSSNALKSPLKALIWLINELNKYNLPLKKGMIIITGTCTNPIKIIKGNSINASFGKLGKISTKII